jgi:hypothetical protein
MSRYPQSLPLAQPPPSARFPPLLCGDLPGRVSGEGPVRSRDHGDLLVVIPIGFPFGKFRLQKRLMAD